MLEREEAEARLMQHQIDFEQRLGSTNMGEYIAWKKDRQTVDLPILTIDEAAAIAQSRFSSRKPGAGNER